MKSPLSSTQSRVLRPGGSIVRLRAFTMLELMIVVGIMALILMMGIPAIRSALRKEAFVQGMNDILDACEFGRSQAIMHDAYMEMRIYPQSHIVEVVPVPRDAPTDGTSPMPSSDSAAASDAPPPPAIKTFSAQMPDRINIDLLDVNFADYKDAEVARIRFYPNGTSSRFTIGIESMDSGDMRVISLEEVTALAEVTNLRP